MNTRALTAISAAELRLFLRNTAVAVSALLMPLVIGGMFVVNGLQDTPESGWGFFVALMLLTVFGMSGCIAAAGTLSYRRDELYLKRLRCSQASDTTILAGVLAPVVLVTIVQCVLMLLMVGAAAGSAPDNLVLVVVAIVLGTVCSVGLGMATTGFSSSGEQAQTVATPVFFVLIGTAIWAALDLAEGLTMLQMLTPGGAVVQLMHLAYAGSPSGTTTGALSDALPAIGGLALWAAVGVGAAKRYFRWEPRH
ncbi:ABC transporter permease [Saccharomonospora azurea]|uniref:ABC-2 type transporter n=1 Tax=Saccharomonospora azurea NA-128 TaxID=882081 RepID=H8GDE2_9PSEU|nr:ABC transporter permease [Saccharomonospora azurea]EHK89292.1 ABC-2 type transporter [Saccharomonospora azurea SZMC 14600]EHY90872.1 ABC-2 type transporter [Saccharomonospora azurea NA-128]